MKDNIQKKVIVNDIMQQGYEYYITEPAGQSFDKRFRPDLTPPDMLALGVFGGVYMRDCKNEFPKEWFVNAKLKTEEKSLNLKNTIDKKRDNKADKNLNYYGVIASQSLKVWREKGWIHQDDPRGWFQWYCRYYMGRRHSDDERQIKRWVNMKRHILWLQGGCGSQGSQSCRPRQRQALLHWAYDSRKL